MKPISVTSIIEHKHEGLPRFVCIPMKAVEPWKISGTTTIELSINGVRLGRRSLKRWDDRNCCWMDLSNDVCRKAKIETGDRVELNLTIASEELPAELLTLIRQHEKARRVGRVLLWDSNACCAKKFCPRSSRQRARAARRDHWELIKTLALTCRRLRPRKLRELET